MVGRWCLFFVRLCWRCLCVVFSFFKNIYLNIKIKRTATNIKYNLFFYSNIGFSIVKKYWVFISINLSTKKTGKIMYCHICSINVMQWLVCEELANLEFGNLVNNSRMSHDVTPHTTQSTLPWYSILNIVTSYHVTIKEKSAHSLS